MALSISFPHPSPKVIWEKGRCRDPAIDTELFYPERDGSTYPGVAAKAKAVCRGRDGAPACPVLLECLFYGLVTNDRFGIWGGMSPRERNALRRGGDIGRYPSAVPLADSPYYGLIQGYLDDHAKSHQAKADQGYDQEDDAE